MSIRAATVNEDSTSAIYTTELANDILIGANLRDFKAFCAESYSVNRKSRIPVVSTDGILHARFSPEVSVPDSESFFQKNEFLIRRLHSLSGLVPVGAYMCVHLVTNASILNGSETFQNAVYQIHSLGNALFAIEWLFIFLPIIFHAVFGFVIMFGGKSNLKNYRYGGNVRYVLQRVTGMIAFVFIFLHVFHLHGWFHVDIWLKSVVEPLGGGQFLPYKASSTLASALQASFLIPLCYAIGVLSCVFHFANGLWTMGITWGVWTSPNAQKRAGYLIAGAGVLLSLIGLSAIAGFTGLDAEKAEEVETQMYENAVEGKRIPAAPHKFYGHDKDHDDVDGSDDEKSNDE